MGLYNFYGNDFIVGYIHKNLIVTIMQFLENKYFVLNEKIISTIIDLSNNIETFLVNNLKINEKKDFIEYSWIMSQFFNFLSHAEDKTESINYGNKIINLYKNKSFISIPIISIKITLYEYYLKNQKENYSEYDTDEHLNNISELLIMFSKCEIEGEINEKYLIKMINHLFKLLTDHIIYITNNRPIQVRNIYNILISINPFMINCRDISNNKNIITKIHLFNIFCSLSNIITNNENNNKEIYQNDIYYYINNIDKKLSKEDKKLFINIMSVLIVYDKNFHQKIFEILITLYKLDDYNQFLEVFFNFCYQLDKMENYNTIVLFDLLNILKNFLNEKFNEKNKKNYNDIIIKFKNNYFGIYKAYVYNAIKYAYESILTINKNENNKKFDVDDDIDSNGLHIKISKSIKLLNKFIEIHNSIIEYFYKIVEIKSYNNQSIYYLPYYLIINYFLELVDCSNESSSKNIIFIYQQIYLIGINESLFSSLPIYIQNFIYYILYRLIHNIYNVINNRDLFLIKGNSYISKTIKTIIYNNIILIKDEQKKNKTNDSFFNLEPLLSFLIIDKYLVNNNLNNIESLSDNFKKELKLNFKENFINQYTTFKINFIMDTNSLIELIKLFYLSGNKIDIKYMENFFNYYIPILNNEKKFSNNFSFILNIFYIIKRIFSIPKTENQNEKIDFDLLCDIIKKEEIKFIQKKNIMIRLLIKYIHITKGKSENKKKINDLLICLLDELKKLNKDKILIHNEQKSQKYFTYIELLSLEFFIKIFNGELPDDDIDYLLYKGKILLIKCLEICKALLNEKYIIQFLYNEKHRLKAMNDFLFEDINKVDLIYLLNMDDFEFILLQLLDKIYILTEFLFKKMFTYGYGDSIIEIFHKFRNFSILKYHKLYFIKFITYLIKVIRKWKRKEKYNIISEICDFKSVSEYNIFTSKLYFNYIYIKYPNYLTIKNTDIIFKDFNIIEFINKNKIFDDPLLNKCLELNNINASFNNKEKSIFFKNKIKSLNIQNPNSNNKELNELKNIFLKEFNISSVISFYLANFLVINHKYIIKIIPRLFENEIINNIISNDKNIDTIINLFKSAYYSYNLKNWQEYKYIKYCKKNLRLLIYISSEAEIYETTIKLINLYITYFHNFKYNLSYKGNDKNKDGEDLNDSIDYLEKINYNETENDKNLDLDNLNNNSNMDIIKDKFNSVNLMAIFRIRNYFYIYIKIKEKMSYDKIDLQKEKDFELFFEYMKNIALKENVVEKIKKKVKNDEYRKALFELQNIIIKYCPNFIKTLKYYFNSHINFNKYINTKIKKYSLKISTNEIINWLFEPNNDKIKNKPSYHNKNNKFKLMSIDFYKKKFINKIFNSNKFKFSFYENNINELLYFLPSIELSKIPLENIPLLFNLAIIRTLNINYIQLNSIIENISITKNIFCLLNPKKDLVDTEKKIFPIIEKNNIKYIKSKEPTENEMNMIIKDKLMYIYCGHGDSLKYLKKEYIESHKINFLTFLFGCNSANSRLLSEKDTQPLSTPQLFLKQLCPFFFGFLWAVTSKDLDDLTVELLEIMFKNKNPISLIKIIILLKRKFNLKWSNGGALVMYSNCDILPKFEK